MTHFIRSIHHLIIAKEAGKQGGKGGEDILSGPVFVDDFVGIYISATPGGLQKQAEKAQDCTTKWRVTAEVNKCAILV